MENPLVSVVVTNYNYGRYLAQAIDSVLAQSYDSIEVIIVDDGSTDESGEILRRYQGRVNSLRQRNGGVSSARNRGLEESRGKFVAFLDADDFWRPQKIARQVELMNSSSIGMVYSGLEYIDASGNPLGTNTAGRSGWVLKDLALLRDPGVPASGSSALVRKSCFDRVGVFDELLSTSADWDMWRRIACHFEIDIVREPLVLYRQHDSAMHGNIETMERDVLRAFSTMFADPSAKEIHPLKRRCYGNLYLTLAGSYLHAGEKLKCLKCLLRSLTTWPPGVVYVMAIPFRRMSRRFGFEQSLSSLS